MSANAVIIGIRALMLTALLVYFAGSLGTGLLREQAGQRVRTLAGRAGEDPGVRVLLLNRGPSVPTNQPQPQPTYTYAQLAIIVLQPAWIVSPDDPDNPERLLKVDAGEKLLVLPDGGDGLLLSSSTWGKEVRWPVSRLRVQPRRTTTLSPAMIAAAKPSGAGVEAAPTPARLDPTRFESADTDAVFNLGGRRYRGSLEVLWKGPKEVVAVNALPLEAYVEGVIAVEMKSSYPLEALKAQAIASRSYAYAGQLRSRKAKRIFDLSDSLMDQEYRGTGHGSNLVATAVRETRGVLLFAGGSPFEPQFCASSGGYTESVDAVLPGDTDVSGKIALGPFMPAKPDPWCQPAAVALGNASSHWQTTAVLSPTMIKRRLDEYFQHRGDNRKIGYVTDIKVTRRHPDSQRVETVLIYLSIGTPVELGGHEFRMLMGPSLIKSTLWTVDSPRKIDSSEAPRTKDYQFQCRGYGHGVGMSQISAWAMASDGLSAAKILEFFYPYAELRPW